MRLENLALPTKSSYKKFDFLRRKDEESQRYCRRARPFAPSLSDSFQADASIGGVSTQIGIVTKRLSARAPTRLISVTR